MNQSRCGERPQSDVIHVDLPSEELERLARVDALLRAVAARDRHGAMTLDCVDPRSVGDPFADDEHNRIDD